ncbi:MAG: hypothetical protein MPL62_10090 [Alphaproteobacteria bacterium]|nr:hypothetical protein [Alphaproteobacteria bacterium]
MKPLSQNTPLPRAVSPPLRHGDRSIQIIQSKVEFPSPCLADTRPRRDVSSATPEIRKKSGQISAPFPNPSRYN